jgi:hypothetical protein
MFADPVCSGRSNALLCVSTAKARPGRFIQCRYAVYPGPARAGAVRSASARNVGRDQSCLCFRMQLRISSGLASDAPADGLSQLYINRQELKPFKDIDVRLRE